MLQRAAEGGIVVRKVVWNGLWRANRKREEEIENEIQIEIDFENGNSRGAGGVAPLRSRYVLA